MSSMLVKKGVFFVGRCRNFRQYCQQNGCISLKDHKISMEAYMNQHIICLRYIQVLYE